MVENKAFQNKFDHLTKNLIYLNVIDDNICGQVPAFFFKVLDDTSQDRKNYMYLIL